MAFNVSLAIRLTSRKHVSTRRRLSHSTQSIVLILLICSTYRRSSRRQLLPFDGGNDAIERWFDVFRALKVSGTSNFHCIFVSSICWRIGTSFSKKTWQKIDHSLHIISPQCHSTTAQFRAGNLCLNYLLVHSKANYPLHNFFCGYISVSYTHLTLPTILRV